MPLRHPERRGALFAPLFLQAGGGGPQSPADKRVAEAEDPFTPTEPGLFYTAREAQYDHWDEPEIIVDPLNCFVTIIPPRGRPARLQPAPGASSPQAPRRERLTPWLRRPGVTTALLFV